MQDRTGRGSLGCPFHSHPADRRIRRVRPLTVLVATAAVGAALAAAAAAQAPFLPQTAGSGNEPTAGGGIFADTRFAARSAGISWDPRARILYLYLFDRRGIRCSSLYSAASVRRGRSVQALVPLRKMRLRPRARIREPFVRFVRRFDAEDVEIQLAQQNIDLLFTRIDTRRKGVWHGRLVVAPRVLSGKRFSYAGTFAARWCGTMKV